jgi:acylphosphatase
MNETRVHVFIKGRVQGVCFRAETRTNAQAHSLSGWARNLPDGRVEAVFEGQKNEVENMLRWCKSGPANALVTDVNVIREEFKNEFDGFSIRF